MNLFDPRFKKLTPVSGTPSLASPENVALFAGNNYLGRSVGWELDATASCFVIWVRPTNLQGSPTSIQTAFSKWVSGGNTANRYLMRYLDNTFGNIWSFNVRNSSNGNPGISAVNRPVEDQWGLLCAYVTPTEFGISYDNEPWVTASGTFVLTSTTQPLFVGSYSSDHEFIGNMASFAVSTEIISDAERTALFNAGPLTKDSMEQLIPDYMSGVYNFAPLDAVPFAGSIDTTPWSNFNNVTVEPYTP